jgi:hypothetical protein
VRDQVEQQTICWDVRVLALGALRDGKEAPLKVRQGNRSKVALDAQTAFPRVLRSGRPEGAGRIACRRRERNGHTLTWIDPDVERLHADLELLHRRPDHVGTDRRLEKDAETTRAMMDCRNLADVTAIQSRWMEETLRDYNSEMGKLMTICTKSLNGEGRAR